MKKTKALMPDATQTSLRKQDTELLTKGVICALIGAIVLVGPYVARGQSVREILQQAYVVGWFALALGAAFIVRYALNRRRSASRKS